MPQIPVRLEEAEALDKKIEGMRATNSAILVQEGGVFVNIFPKTMDKSRVYKRTYLIALGTGRILFTKMAEVSIFFDYRSNRAEVQLTRKALENLNDIFPEIVEYRYRMVNVGKIDCV